jgi:hypothetical protein
MNKAEDKIKSIEYMSVDEMVLPQGDLNRRPNVSLNTGKVRQVPL